MRAVYRREKGEILDEINIHLDVVRLLMRTAADMKYVSLKRYDYFCRCVNEIGRMAGGWKKSLSGSQSSGGQGCRKR